MGTCALLGRAVLGSQWSNQPRTKAEGVVSCGFHICGKQPVHLPRSCGKRGKLETVYDAREIVFFRWQPATMLFLGTMQTGQIILGKPACMCDRPTSAKIVFETLKLHTRRIEIHFRWKPRLSLQAGQTACGSVEVSKGN